MENQQTSNELFELSFDERTKQSLRAAAVTAGIAAILSIVGGVLGVVNYFVEANRPAPVQIEGFGRTSAAASGGNLFSIIISFGIAILLFYFLNRFSTLTKTGVDGNGQSQVAEGLAALANYFKTVGILLIIVIALVLLVILAFGVGSR